MKIGELQRGMSNVSLEGKVVDVGVSSKSVIGNLSEKVTCKSTIYFLEGKILLSPLTLVFIAYL